MDDVTVEPTGCGSTVLSDPSSHSIHAARRIRLSSESKPDLENDPSIPDHRFPSIGQGAEPSESGTLDERLWYGVQESLALVRWTIGEYWDVVELIGLA